LIESRVSSLGPPDLHQSDPARRSNGGNASNLGHAIKNPAVVNTGLNSNSALKSNSWANEQNQL